MVPALIPLVHGAQCQRLVLANNGVFVSRNRRRHRDIPVVPRWRRALVVATGIVVAIALVAGGVAVGSSWSGGSLESFFASGAGCGTTTKLTIVSDPSIAPVLKTVAKTFDGRKNACVKTTVQSQQSADTAALLASGVKTTADAWVPDSSVWLERMAATASSLGRAAPTVEAGKSIATTPVVFAAPAARAAEFAAAPVGWSTLLGGTVDALLPDPESSAASLAALFTLRTHSSVDDPRQFAGAMIELGKAIPQSAALAFSSARVAVKPTVVLTTEHEVAAHNASDPSNPLIALYPTDGTTALTYPFVRISGNVQSAAPGSTAVATSTASASPTANPQKTASVSASLATTPGASKISEAKTKLLESFATLARAATTSLATNGFRNGAGTGELTASGVVALPAKASPIADGAAQIEILHSWSVLTLRSRMLAVIDVSGSMLEPAGAGLRRIDIFQRAAAGALQKFSGEVEMGVWVFSTARAGTQDWEDLSPIAPLSDPAHTSQIQQIIASLPSRVHGDTALYDTTLAAVQRVREGYDPSKVNSVLLFTDGRNEDKNGIDLQTLLSKLKAMDDPLKPVPVIMIGFGPDTDIAAMTQIAHATGGAAYSASKPEDLGLVLVDALSQRSCRPNC